MSNIFESPIRITVIGGVGLVCLVGLIIGDKLRTNSPTLGTIEYHERKRRETFETWEKDGRVYFFHLEQLIQLGVLEKWHYTFSNVTVPSKTGDAIQEMFSTQKCPPCEFFESPCPLETAPLEVTVWFRPNAKTRWQTFFKTHDTNENKNTQ